MKNFARGLVLLTSLLSTLAVAQWQWLDKDGRTVFSDRAPPVSVPDKAIVKRPGAAQPQPAAAAVDESVAGAAPTPSPAASAPKALGVDKDLQEKKKKAEADEAAKRKVEEQRIQAAKAENCQRAKSAKAGLDSGVRLSRTNAQGEREVMDDPARAAEAKRVQSIIDTDCK